MGPCRVKRSNLTSIFFISFHFSSFLCLSCLFFTFPCSWLALHVSWFFPIICSLLFIPTLIFFLFATFTDPGILHKGTEELVNQSVTRRASNHHWCNKCQLHWLPRTVHCSWCNTCVEGFVCHCKWINGCVTTHNIYYFFLFVVFLGVYGWAMLSYCLVYLGLNFREPFGVEKICTVVVTIGTALYLLPLFTLDASEAAQNRRKLKAHALQWKPFRSHQAWWQPSAWRVQPGTEYRDISAMPKAKPRDTRKAFVIIQVPPVCSFTMAAPASSPHSCPPDVPVEWKGAKAWRFVLAALQRVLPQKGPVLGKSTQQAAPKAGTKKSSRPLNTMDRSTESLTSEMQLLEEDQDIHWKCQLFINRRPPSSPTGTLLSVSDI